MHGVRRLAIVFTLVVCAVAAACVDMSAPKGAASISLLQLPSNFIVLRDTMRDTNGVAMPPTVIAYDASGNPLPDESAKAQFFIIDSLPVAHFANGLLVGDAIGTVHVVGQIGNVPTPAVAIPVGLAPDTLFTTLPSPDSLLVPGGTDSALTIGTLLLPIVVQADDHKTGVQGVIVTYTLSPLPSKTSSPSVYLDDGSGNLSTIDTTDASGQASRRLVANAVFLTATDTVLVTVSAKYKGSPLKGSGLTFRLPITITF